MSVEIRDEVHAASFDADVRGDVWTWGSRTWERDAAGSASGGIEKLDGGAMSAATEPFEIAIRDAKALAGLWAGLNAGRADADGNPPPEPDSWKSVDFSRETVLAVGLGSRPTSGFSVEILEVRPRGDGAEALWREVRPARDCINLQVITNPWVAVRVPRIEGDVSFRGTVVERPCGDAAEPAR